MDRTEAIILRGLIYDDQYTRRVLPFLKEDYWQDRTERLIFTTIKKFLDQYRNLPTKETILVDLANNRLSTDEYDEVKSYLTEVESEKTDQPNTDWLTNQTEQWCKDQAVEQAVMEVLSIIQDPKSKKEKGLIPKLLQDALAVSFDPHVGHDYLEDAEARFEFYNRIERRIPFHLDYFNKITKNGVPNKTLNVILAGTGVGKSLFMCDLAANYLMGGKNVLYITMEMAEERIAERIDANLMDIPLDELKGMPKVNFDARMQRINARTKGKLIVKEYATAQAHVGHFRHLMDELALKKKFKPDVVFIDYLNICASARMKIGSGGMYEFVKAIAEELRGFGVEFNVPIWTATQMNRAGFNNNDPDLTNTSESFGLPATADFMFALIADEELLKLNQLLVKILKNRYGDVNLRNKETGNIMNRFLIGVDRSKMKLYNLDESAQGGLNNEEPTAPAPQLKAALPLDDDDDFEGGVTLSNSPTKPPTMPFRPEPVFDIDEPGFNEAAEEAERRRNSTKAVAAAYKPNLTSQYKVEKKLIV